MKREETTTDMEKFNGESIELGIEVELADDDWHRRIPFTPKEV